jgi:hypothetical protein
MAATNHLPLRAARDRLIDMLGFGQTYPLRDLAVRDEQLTVAFNTPAEIPIENSQYGVWYQLHDDGQLVERIPDGSEEPARPIQGEGTGDTLILKTNRIQEDITYQIHAQKIRGKYGEKITSGNAAYLHQTATVKVGLDISLRAWILAPSLDSAVTNPTGTQARVISYQKAVDVEIENSQEGVDYHLVYLTESAEEVVLSEPKRGDLDNIKLRSDPVTEDIEIRIRATKTFDPSEDRETETDLLKVVLPLKVRANPDLPLTLDPVSVIGYQQPLSIKIVGTQERVKYQLFVRPIRDQHFYPQLYPKAESITISVEGEPQPLQVCRPTWDELWATPEEEEFVPWNDEPLAGNGGELTFKIDSMTADHLFIIYAQKMHTVNGETIQEIPSQVQLRPAAAVLVGPNPDIPLKVQVMMNEGETDGQMLLLDGQPGVFYYFRLEPEGEELSLPGYFHQRDDKNQLLNKGVGQLGLERDFVIGRRSATDSQIDPAASPPLPPLLETGPLPGGTTLHITAKKAMNRVSVPLTASASISALTTSGSASIPALPQIRLQDPIVDYDKTTKILVIGSLIGDRYQPYLGSNPIKKARLGNEKDLSFISEPMKEDTTYQVRVTRPKDKGIAVERVVHLRAIVRPNTRLAISAADDIVDFNGETTIQIESSQTGVHYQLTANGKNIGEPTAGRGETLSLLTGPLKSATTFTVRAIKEIDSNITADLAQTVTVQVRPEQDKPPAEGVDGNV